jgi:hypothetical protein
MAREGRVCAYECAHEGLLHFVVLLLGKRLHQMHGFLVTCVSVWPIRASRGGDIASIAVTESLDMAHCHTYASPKAFMLLDQVNGCPSPSRNLYIVERKFNGTYWTTEAFVVKNEFFVLLPCRNEVARDCVEDPA